MSGALKTRLSVRGCMWWYFYQAKSCFYFAHGFVPAFNWSDRHGSSLIISAR